MPGSIKEGVGKVGKERGGCGGEMFIFSPKKGVG